MILDKETQRFASTADVMVGDQSLLQFELSMGCDEKKVKTQQCFGEYQFICINSGIVIRNFEYGCYEVTLNIDIEKCLY